MITRNRTQTVLTLAVILGVLAAFSGSLQAKLLVYEPFDYPTGDIVDLPVNATGLTGIWYVAAVDGAAPKINAWSMNYGDLPKGVGGNWGTGHVWTQPEIQTTLDPAVFEEGLDDGDELWFSYLGSLNLPDQVTNQNRNRLQIGSDMDNHVGIYVSKINAATGAQIQATITVDGIETLSEVTDAAIFPATPQLFVGRVIFGAIDTVEVYLPGPDLVKPETPAGTVTGSIDQSTFVMLRAVIFNGNTLYYDEIRIGTSYEDVVGAVVTKAHNPNPADGAGDVARTPTFNWTPGEFAAPTNGHKVYFGESFNDVNDGIGGVAQTATSYTPAQRLDFGKTYYWRVDEVNAPPDSTVYPGEVWSFTTELLAYPIENVIATASSSNVGEGAENTVNDSGVDANDLHSTETTDMWLSSADGDGPARIEYEFDRVSKLHEMWVWNHNSSLEQIYGFGFKDVSVEYSVDGIEYEALGTTHEFAQAPGTPGYAHETIDFEGVAAKYVRLTANSTWGSVLSGLSEVRFFEIPVHAKKPYPDNGATDVDPDVILGWKAGREAASHDVYVGTDPNALTPAGPVTEPVFDTASLDLILGQTYHWLVDEVNDAEIPTTWQGDLWSFTTQEYRVVEDFESYNDIDPPDPESHTIFVSWLDGYLTPATNGALVGYEPAQPPSQPSYMEHTIVYDGDQSLPFSYNNTIASYSEASVNIDDLAIGRDWAKYSPTTLLLRFYGDPNNDVQQMYLKINDTPVPYDGPAENLQLPSWLKWRIDLTSYDISNVTTLTIGFERMAGAGGQGKVLIDAIQLVVEEQATGEIIVPDASFDDQVLDSGGYAYITEDYTGPWQAVDGTAWIDNGYYPGDLPAHSGNNKLNAWDDWYDEPAVKSVYQILNDTFIEGQTYTLSVWVALADRGDGHDPGWTLSFIGEDYDTILSEVSGEAPVGTWEQVSLVYKATAADAGNKIGIKLKGNATVCMFDDVTLFRSVPVDIVVPDASFDDQVLDSGGYAYITEDYTGPWQAMDGTAWIDNGYYPGDLPAHSGNNKLNAWDDWYDEPEVKSVYQILNDTFIEGQTYTLSVWVALADRGGGHDPGWTLSFIGEDYDTILSEVSGNAPVGTWEQVSLVYTATAADAGNKIGIKLKGNATVCMFDDVTLSRSSDE